MKKLSNTEKYAIQGMLHDKKEVAEIAREIECNVKLVQFYIDHELSKIYDTVVTNELKKHKEEKISISKLKEEVLTKMGTSGIETKIASRLVNTALKKHPKPPNVDILFNWAMAELNAGDLMVKKTRDKNRSGIVVMTEAASEKGDAFLSKLEPTLSRRSKKAIYSISEDKILE